ncbi:MAG TPA: ABC transporter ATP-binding protein [Burkholderiales bacterium]|nr:ABC transporter ATP-binding protein [Burkholderiales bacterium]
MSEPLLSLDVVSKSFNGRQVLRRVSVRVRPGEVVSLLGPSGCGKSTLLRIVAGLERDYDGRALVKGEPVHVHSPHTGIVFQEPRLLPWLTVAQNVGFEEGGRGAGDPRTRALLEEVGLADCGDAWPKQLSGGMAQRVAIARGLFSQPELLLLDEPFSALDAFTRMRLQDLLLGVARRHRTALLMVTHDVDEALYLSDRVLVMGARPGTIREEVELPMPHPRDRADPALARRKARVLDALKDSLAGGARAA